VLATLIITSTVPDFPSVRFVPGFCDNALLRVHELPDASAPTATVVLDDQYASTKKALSV